MARTGYEEYKQATGADCGLAEWSWCLLPDMEVARRVPWAPLRGNSWKRPSASWTGQSWSCPFSHRNCRYGSQKGRTVKPTGPWSRRRSLATSVVREKIITHSVHFSVLVGLCFSISFLSSNEWNVGWFYTCVDGSTVPAGSRSLIFLRVFCSTQLLICLRAFSEFFWKSTTPSSLFRRIWTHLFKGIFRSKNSLQTKQAIFKKLV